jgi:hypothetical protein
VPLAALAVLTAAAAVVAVTMAMTVTSAAPAATRTGQEPREQRVELGHPVTRNVDRDLRVLRFWSEIRLHLYLFLLLTYASIAQVIT